ncbi:DUF1989 domain-containing protein, partial [Klebsiella quasipneumoniae]|uniref:DUF1989 domain-containing protein n=1 Tax=Klebsiella quasipneumoniae TaxID=1463165 RepID=UPI0027318487
MELDLDQTVTRTLNGSAYPAPGLFSKFFDRQMQPMLEVVRDTVGRHDSVALACAARYYESHGYFGHDNCSELWVKLECNNPDGSVQDLAALSMIVEAEKRGDI